MGDLVPGDDGLPVEEVGSWARQKHLYLCRYIDITRAVRKQFIGPGKAGATYIDLFCGPGRAKVRRGEFIDGSCVAAWKESVAKGAPFSRVYIADADPERLGYAEQRLKKLGAPVVAVPGLATDTAAAIAGRLHPRALHFAFIDPFNLGAFDFGVVETLSRLQRIDMLVHVSKMDLQRNLGFNLVRQETAFDRFAPGWRENVNLQQSQPRIRRDIFEYWRGLVDKTGVSTSVDMKLIRGNRNQPLYWLLLAARHDLAHKLWKPASEDAQTSLLI